MRSTNLRSLRQRVATGKVHAFRRARDAVRGNIDEGLQEWFLPSAPHEPMADWDDSEIESWRACFGGVSRWGRWENECPCCRKLYSFYFGLYAARNAQPFEIAALCLLEGRTDEDGSAVGYFTESLRSAPGPHRYGARGDTVAMPPALGDAATLSAADRRVVDWYAALHTHGPEPLVAAIAAEPREFAAFRTLRQRVVSRVQGLAPPDRYVDEHWDVERAALLAMLTFPVWRGSLAEWRGGSAVELLRHLLGPSVDMQVLFDEVTESTYSGAGRRRVDLALDPRSIVTDPLLWIVAEAQGASIRRIGRHFGVPLPAALVAMAHALIETAGTEPRTWAPYDLRRHVTRARVRCAGGTDVEWHRSSALRDELVETAASYPAFWRSAIAWLTRWRDALGDEQAYRAMSWGLHRYTEDARFSFTGRSARAVMRHVEEYEDAIRRRDEEQQRAAQPAALAGPATSPLAWSAHGWDLEWRDDADTDWRMQELTDARMLAEEGAALAHCVGAYAEQCFAGESAIAQLRCGGRRTATIEVRLRDRRVVQARGRSNSPLGDDAGAALRYWATQFGLTIDA